MALTHEQAVRNGRMGGLARRRGKRLNNDVMLSVRVPRGLKEWYDRRAIEQEVSTGTLVREILQARRAVMSGKPRDY